MRKKGKNLLKTKDLLSNAGSSLNFVAYEKY